MGIFTSLFEKRNLTEKQWLMDWLGGPESATGIRVSQDNAMKYSAVYGCVKLLSETVASIPFIVYKKLAKGKERAVDHGLYRILHTQPNSEMTSFIFRETMMVHLLLWGNFYAEIEYDNGGNVKALWLLLPWNMKVERFEGKLIYRYTLPNGKEKIIPKGYIYHVAGMGYNGLVGKSPITMAREAIGLGLALEEFGGRFFSNSANTGGVAMHPKDLSDKAYKRLKKQLNEKYTGLKNSHRLLILEEGMKFDKTSIPPDDAQFLESRDFQTLEICRFYGMKPHMIANLTKSSFNNIEQQSLEYVIFTARPWFVRIEQYTNIKLFTEAEQNIYFVEFLVVALLRGDTKTRFEAYSIARQNGWMSADDIRELENMNPLPNGQGKVYWMPLNMIEAPGDNGGGQSGQRMITAGRAANLKEERAMRSAVTRKRLGDNYRGVFEDSVSRIVIMEKKDILKAARSIFDKRNAEALAFYDYLEEYYGGIGDKISKMTGPVFSSFGKAISKEALEEIHTNIDIGKELDKYIYQYQDKFNQRYAGSSRGQLKQVVKNAFEEGNDPVVKLEERLTEWEEKRPAKSSLNEVVKMAGAIAVFTFAAGGITKLIWVNTGSKSCPYCEEMSGQVMGINQAFKTKTDSMKPEGAESTLTFSTDIFHPPLHGGCMCQISSA